MHVFISSKEEQINHLEKIIVALSDQIQELQEKVKANEKQATSRKDSQIHNRVGFKHDRDAKNSLSQASLITKTDKLLKDPQISVSGLGSTRSERMETDSVKRKSGIRKLVPNSLNEIKRFSGGIVTRGSRLDAGTNPSNVKVVQLHGSSKALLKRES